MTLDQCPAGMGVFPIQVLGARRVGEHLDLAGILTRHLWHPGTNETGVHHRWECLFHSLSVARDQRPMVDGTSSAPPSGAVQVKSARVVYERVSNSR